MKLCARLITFIIAFASLSNCSSSDKESFSAPDATGQAAATGYWYLGDNGQKQWRVLEPDEAKNNNTFTRQYPREKTPFGAGSGH